MREGFYLGQIIQFSGDYEFERRLFCDERTLNISNYTAPLKHESFRVVLGKPKSVKS
jgi:hypothetical protein